MRHEHEIEETIKEIAAKHGIRYQHDAGITEFWGHHASSTYVDCDQGLVGIPG